jgi:hypothetical protein
MPTLPLAREDSCRSGPSNQADSKALSEVEGRRSAKRTVRARTGCANSANVRPATSPGRCILPACVSGDAEDNVLPRGTVRLGPVCSTLAFFRDPLLYLEIPVSWKEPV